MTEKNKIIRAWVDMTFNEKFETEKEFLKLANEKNNLKIIEIGSLKSEYGDFAEVLVEGKIEDYIEAGYDEDEILEFAENLKDQ